MNFNKNWKPSEKENVNDDVSQMDKDEAVISDKPPKLCNCDFGECDFSDENDDATVPEGWKPEADQKDIIITEG